MVINTIETEPEPEPDIGGHSQNDNQQQERQEHIQQIHFIDNHPSEKSHKHTHHARHEHGEKAIMVEGLNIPGREFVPTHQEPMVEEPQVAKYPEPTWKASFIVCNPQSNQVAIYLLHLLEYAQSKSNCIGYSNSTTHIMGFTLCQSVSSSRLRYLVIVYSTTCRWSIFRVCPIFN